MRPCTLATDVVNFETSVLALLILHLRVVYRRQRGFVTRNQTLRVDAVEIYFASTWMSRPGPYTNNLDQEAMLANRTVLFTNT
jgi:hypothetical protein